MAEEKDESLLRMALAGRGPVHFPSAPNPHMPAQAMPPHRLEHSDLHQVSARATLCSPLESVCLFYIFLLFIVRRGGGECECHTPCVGAIGQLRTVSSFLAQCGTELRSTVSDSKLLYRLSCLDNPPSGFSIPAPFAALT